MMNDLYANEWSLYQNYFCPTMKLIEKTKINSRYKRKYDEPTTPFQRVLACQSIDEDSKDKLSQTYQSINPFTLKQAIEDKLKLIFKHVAISSHVRHRI